MDIKNFYNLLFELYSKQENIKIKYTIETKKISN